MAGTIVPAKSAYRLEQRARHVKNALPFLDGSAVILSGLVVRVERNALKEVCWRKLFRITNNHHLPASRECADCIFRLQLRGLVHDDKIELELSGSKVLSNGQRPHHKARLESDQCAGGSENELPYRNVALLFIKLVHDERHFGPMT